MKSLVDALCSDIFLFCFEVVILVQCPGMHKTVTVDRALYIKFSSYPPVTDNQSPYR